MKVHELLELLENLDGDATVALNRHDTLYEVTSVRVGRGPLIPYDESAGGWTGSNVTNFVQIGD